MERDSRRIAREWNREIEAEIRRRAARRDDGWGRFVVWAVLELVWLVAVFAVLGVFLEKPVRRIRHICQEVFPCAVLRAENNKSRPV